MSQLTLSHHDVDRLSATMRALASPLDYTDEEAWRRAIVEKMREALDTDWAGVIFRGDQSSMITNFDASAVREYMDHWFQTITGDARRRAAGMTSWVRADVWSLEELREDAYFHEWCVPNGNLDSAGMCEYQGDGQEIAVYVNATRAGRFARGGREALLLRLLQPSLSAGVALLEGVGRWGSEPDALAADPSPLAIFGSSGRLLHATQGLAALLEDDRDGPIIAGAARELAACCRLPGRAPKLVVDAGRGRYVLYASLVEARFAGRDPLCVVTVKPPTRRKNLHALRRAYGLTPREAEVAMLLASGRRNTQVARSLAISEHTARRHTEKVLRKLGVSSRAEVASAVSRA